MIDVKEIYKQVKDDYKNYPTQAEFDRQWMFQLEQMQPSKEKNNDRRAKFVKVSMYVFLFAVFLVIGVSAWVIVQFING